MRHRALSGAAAGIVMMGSALGMCGRGKAQAAWVESLLMPGEVIEGHAELETKCSACHERFEKMGQARLCLACHTGVKLDLDAQRGFHGRAPAVRDQPCKLCHTDHRGRHADIVRLDPETFAHDLSDFPLRGAHRRARCDGCHDATKKHREAPNKCAACHANDDPHEASVGNACGNCHDEGSWQAAGFDHARTDFPLQGRHREVTCESCHRTQRYKPTSRHCQACHEADDKHAGRFGGKCQDCHESVRWAQVTFNHAKDTRFRLEGRHTAVPCEQCHPGRLFDDATPQSCDGCHARDDVHRGRFGSKCESCHLGTAWKAGNFDHDRDTRYPLRGKHARVACNDCHREGRHERKLETSCHACHQTDDVHKSQEGESCERCHDERGWRHEVFFDHDLTRLPLIGTHALVPCEECHVSKAFKDTPLDCASCHTSVDVHRGNLGPKCNDCHNPNGWKLWDFDHGARTRFALDGAHQRLLCRDCHREPMQMAAAPRNCSGCHTGDDVHRGQYGRSCERCHVTTSFRAITRLR